MAGGLRDLLALQGVIPLSKVLATTTPGLTLGQATGVWITGATPVTGNPGLTLLQLSGVWITGATTAVIAIPDTGGRSPRGNFMMKHILREDEELLTIIAAAVRIVN